MIGEGCCGMVRSNPIFEKPGSSALIIPTNQLIISTHRSPMRRKPTECANVLPTPSINKLQNCHFFIHICCISISFLLWVHKVSTWASINPRICNIPCHLTTVSEDQEPKSMDKIKHCQIACLC